MSASMPSSLAPSLSSSLTSFLTPSVDAKRAALPVWLRAVLLIAFATLISMSLPMLAHAGIPDKPATIVTNIVTMLTGLGVGLFTAACMWTGYKMAFAGAQFRDVSNILWGGVLAGGAAGFAGWLFS